jgi:hypothetical protein
MTRSNKRSNVVGAVGAVLPALGTAIGLAAIAGVTGCHMEVLLIPISLLALGAVAAIVLGAVAIPLRRSKRGLIMPVLAILTGVISLGGLVAIPW